MNIDLEKLVATMNGMCLSKWHLLTDEQGKQFIKSELYGGFTVCNGTVRSRKCPYIMTDIADNGVAIITDESDRYLYLDDVIDAVIGTKRILDGIKRMNHMEATE